jgi:hypothetical protein
VKRLMLVLALAVGVSACASVNVKMEKLTRDAISSSEQMRCGVHVAPCLSEVQFKAVNAELYKASVVGGEVTKLARAGTVKPADYARLVKTVEDALATLATQVFPPGTLDTIVDKMRSLDSQARKLAGL